MLLSQTLQPFSCHHCKKETTSETTNTVKKKQLHKTQKTEQILNQSTTVSSQKFSSHFVSKVIPFNKSLQDIKKLRLFTIMKCHISTSYLFTFVYVRRPHTWKRWKQQLKKTE